MDGSSCPIQGGVIMSENIDGYVSKDNLYRLLSTYRMTHMLTDKEQELLVKIAIAIKDMPNEKE